MTRTAVSLWDERVVSGGREHKRILCCIISIEYLATIRTGVLRVPSGHATNMPGVIELFESIDPEAQTVHVEYPDGRIDITYARDNGVWVAKPRRLTGTTSLLRKVDDV